MTTAYFICIILFAFADVAHLVERHLAKVEVASSSLVIRSTYAPVAQLDRVSGYEPEGQGFESLPARQKRSNFCLPKVTSFFIQAAGLVYHHDAVVYIISPFGAVSHHASACIPLRLDEMQHCVLMICNSCGIDDIQGFALICSRKSSIILLKGVVICRKIIC